MTSAERTADSKRTTRRDEMAARFNGRVLVDVQGGTIGTIVGLKGRGGKRGQQWLLVETESPESRRILIPIDRVSDSGERLVTPYHGTYVKGAPSVVDEGKWSAAEVRRLYLHYGLRYVPPGGDNSGCCGLCQVKYRGTDP